MGKKMVFLNTYLKSPEKIMCILIIEIPSYFL